MSDDDRLLADLRRISRRATDQLAMLVATA